MELGKKFHRPHNIRQTMRLGTSIKSSILLKKPKNYLKNAKVNTIAEKCIKA